MILQKEIATIAEQAVKMAWRKSLSHQIPSAAFPDFDTVKIELENLFLKVFTFNA